MTTAPVTALVAFTIDTPDAIALAHFYGDLTGGEVTEFPEWGVASMSLHGTTLNFQKVEDYTRPRWPSQEHPQQYHLDFRVDDLEGAVDAARRLGAEPAAEQPSPESYRVMLDPHGHPFCLCPPTQG